MFEVFELVSTSASQGCHSVGCFSIFVYIKRCLVCDPILGKCKVVKQIRFFFVYLLMCHLLKQRAQSLYWQQSKNLLLVVAWNWQWYKFVFFGLLYFTWLLIWLYMIIRFSFELFVKSWAVLREFLPNLS